MFRRGVRDTDVILLVTHFAKLFAEHEGSKQTVGNKSELQDTVRDIATQSEVKRTEPRGATSDALIPARN